MVELCPLNVGSPEVAWGNSVLSHCSWGSCGWYMGKWYRAGMQPGSQKYQEQGKIIYKATEYFSSLPLTFFNKLLLPLRISS